MIDDETLIAYLDGELDAAEVPRVEASLANDPLLAERLELQLRLKARVAGAFDSILAEPMPAAISEAARPPAEVVDLAVARARRKAAPLTRRWGEAAAIAASLIVGLIGGVTLINARPDALTVAQGGVFASGALGRALDTQLASAPGDVRVQLSFRDSQGRACRTFAWTASEGVACKEQDGWAIEGLFGRKSESGGSEYRMAAGQSPALMLLAEQMMAGEPMTASQEEAALASNWRQAKRP